MSERFQKFLSRLATELTKQARRQRFRSSTEFEGAVRATINEAGGFEGSKVDLTPHPHLFPDILIPPFGIEVKFSENDTWRSVANSILESRRGENIQEIYVVFGKMGGQPEVRWDQYENCVMHVRTSHVPRFELEIGSRKSIFKQFGISYSDFQRLGVHERMEYVRSYARGRLKPGERLWWLEDPEQPVHTLPLQARLYMSLDQTEKRQLRAEAALLCPSILKGSRSKGKYDDVALYLVTYHGVIAPQVRDLFSAGSVALLDNDERGGLYLQRALENLQPEMRTAAATLDERLFIEYWGRSVPPDQRLREWLRMADRIAADWTPSCCLFPELR